MMMYRIKRMLDDVKRRPIVGFIYLVALAFILVVPWLGIHSVVLFADGNKDPSLPLSTHCPALDSSMMPNQYQIEKSTGWNYRSRVKVDVTSLDIGVEHRCFNGGIGSVFLFVNGQLAAFSRVNLDIYDCHGKLLYNTAYDSSTNGKPKLKVTDPNGKWIWESDIPASSKDLVVYSPEGLPVATVSKSLVTIQNAQSPAADPRLIIITHAQSWMKSNTGYNSQIFVSDGCNSFVFYGGIIDIVFLCLILAAFARYGVPVLLEKYRGRHRSVPSNHHKLEAIQDTGASNAFAPAHAAHSAPPQEAAAPAVPNSDGFILSGAGIDSVNGIYIRRTDVTRNNAAIFENSFQPSVEVFLDISGDSFCWAIQVNKRIVYRMLPNPLDPGYVTCPSFEGAWVVVDAMPGEVPIAPTMFATHGAQASNV